VGGLVSVTLQIHSICAIPIIIVIVIMAVDPPEGYEFVVEDFTKNFKWPEYIVFCAVLVASLGIGVFYGCFGTKNKSNEEFLMAGRSMSITPVTLSLVCR